MMTRRQANAAILAGAALAAVPAATLSQALKPLTLPPARSEGGVPLTQALLVAGFPAGPNLSFLL